MMSIHRLPIGIIHTAYGEYGFYGAIEKIAEHGYDAVDYQKFINTKTDFFSLPLAEFYAAVREDKKIIDGFGIKVSQTHAPWTWRPCDMGEDWVEAMKKAIAGASVLGSALFVVHPRMPYMESDRCPDEVFAINGEFITRLADFALDYGVTICLENMPWRTFPLSRIEDTVRLCDAVGRENVGICLDTGHANIFKNGDVADAVYVSAGRLKALHIHDNRGEDDEHLVIGEGIINWEGFAKALKDIGFRGTVSVEANPKRVGASEDKWRECELSLLEKTLKIAEAAY